MRRFVPAILAGVVGLMLVTAPAAVALTRTTVYNNIPRPLPGNVPSVAFESNGISEFGGQVSLRGTARNNPSVRVVMSSWACQTGGWSTFDCSTTPGATFSLPLTVNVYTVGPDNQPGTLIGAVTRTTSMPYRPSANDTQCTGVDAGKWYSSTPGKCFNGKAFTRAVSLGSLVLPDTVIIGVAYNTTHYGYNPIGESASCYTSSGGCFYDALNVGTSDSLPAAGSQPLPADAYLNSTQPSAYCDNGTGGLDTFRLDAGCWTGFQPAFKVRAAA